MARVKCVVYANRRVASTAFFLKFFSLFSLFGLAVSNFFIKNFLFQLNSFILYCYLFNSL